GSNRSGRCRMARAAQSPALLLLWPPRLTRSRRREGKSRSAGECGDRRRRSTTSSAQFYVGETFNFVATGACAAQQISAQGVCCEGDIEQCRPRKKKCHAAAPSNA